MAQEWTAKIMSDTDMLYIASLEKRIEMLEHENEELKMLFVEIVYDVVKLNEKTVSIIHKFETLTEKDSETK